MDRAQIVHNAIKEYYLNLGRTEEQWQVVSKNPAKFNLVWRRALKLKGEGAPPDNLRNINPMTGEIIT